MWRGTRGSTVNLLAFAVALGVNPLGVHAEPECHLDASGSRVWVQADHSCEGHPLCEDRKHFNLIIDIVDFVPFMRLSVAWPPTHSEIVLEDLYGATVLDSSTHVLQLQAGTLDGTHGQITLVGQGSLDKAPVVDCHQPDAAPPSPPHILECELDAEYKTEHAWDNGQYGKGENAHIHFYKWEDDRGVRLVFHDQPDIEILHINNAMVESHFVVGRDTVYHLDLFEQFDAEHPVTHTVRRTHHLQLRLLFDRNAPFLTQTDSTPDTHSLTR